MSWTDDFHNGAAMQLAAQGVGTYAPDAVVTSGATGVITIGPLPAAAVSGIAIQSYRIGNDSLLFPTTTRRLRLNLRAAAIPDLDDMDDACYQALQGLTNVTWASVIVQTIDAISSVPLGPDGNGRQRRTLDFRCDLTIPATALRSY